MKSPMLALMSLGTNVRAPLPTSTEMVAAVATAAEAAATRAVEKYMLRLEIFKRVLLKEICKSTVFRREGRRLILRYKWNAYEMKGKRSDHQDSGLPLYLCGRDRKLLLATRQWQKIIFLDLESGRICTAGFGCGGQGNQPHWAGPFQADDRLLCRSHQYHRKRSAQLTIASRLQRTLFASAK